MSEMAEPSFDVAIHLGPGVSTLHNTNTNSADIDPYLDPNKKEVKCSAGLLFGISMSIG